MLSSRLANSTSQLTNQPTEKESTMDTVSYSYDNLGRLTTITYSNGTTVTFSYDNMGNRTSVAISCSGGGC
ncbi:MAG: RHS repeat domain-containing protein [Candidatus Obscuribacterales bacterium]